MILSYVAEHQGKFPTDTYLKSNSEHGYNDAWGMIAKKNGKQLLHIGQEKLDDILRQRTNYSTSKEVIGQLHARGYLQKYYEDRYLVSFKFGNIAVKGYTIILPPEESPTVNPPKHKKYAKQTQIDRLLVDEE